MSAPGQYEKQKLMDGYKSYFAPDLLEGRVALITGGGSGIGFGIAEVLLRHGAKVVIASRSIGRVQQAKKQLEEAFPGAHCMALQLDVRDPPSIIAAVEEILRNWGQINILINNAAGNFLCPASSLSYNAFKTVMEIDAVGTFNVSKTVFDKYMGAHGGTILNISATLHYNGMLLQTHAGSAKAAIDGMTKHLCNEWGPLGIRVNAIAPGPIEDTIGLKKLMPMEERMEALANFPLKRLGTKRDIADAALFLVSDAASYVTGTVFVVDGGAWMAVGAGKL